MWRSIIEILKLTLLSLEITFCIGIFTQIFLERSKINLERILLYSGMGILSSLFIYFRGGSVEDLEVSIYTLWGVLIVVFLYKGTIFYKIWSMWVAYEMLIIVVGSIELVLGIILFEIGDLDLIGEVIMNEWICIPEIISVIIAFLLIKSTPFYYKDKACYRKLSPFKKIVILIIMNGIGQMAGLGMDVVDGLKGNVAQGNITLFLSIYVVIILGSAIMLQSYGEIHNTYTNKEALLIQSFTEKHVVTAKQLEKQDLFNQKDKEMLHQQISGLAQLAEESGFEEIRQYAEELASAVEPMNQEFLLTGHRVLDALLREKYLITKEKGIKLANKISIPDHIALNSTELSIIVGQALDYAIRQCEAVKGEKSILVEGVWYKGYIMLKLWYSHAEEATEDKKTELQVIERYIKKYEGQLNEVVALHRNKLELRFNATS
ncbi:ATP-binding protein [Cellulosilyticum ruminicola]|uniref:hypothetical protein n=1 Tax=Cellulosilyticum ruminicola TaxID=425254 RepID=UPI0006CFB921|nr:hypothetical protein [Cellulosilyticum ruminicola]